MAFSVSGAACGLPLGLVWARSAVAPGCVTSGFLLQVAVCPAHAAKFIFLSSSDLPPQNYLPCRALQEEWQRQLSCPDLSCSLSFVPAGLHLLPCVKVSVEPPHGGLASRTNENNGINTNTMWQKRNSQIRSPAMTDVWPQKHLRSMEGKEVWYTSNQEHGSRKEHRES